MKPNAIGERIAASADPVFIIPLAVPEYFGAISIGIAHIGPMTSSAKKNAAPSASAMSVRSRVANIGSRQKNEPRKPITMTLRRPFRTSPVRFRIPSLISPPSKSPPTPAKNTADAKSADRRRSSWYSFRKNDGSQFRYSHSVQP